MSVDENGLCHNCGRQTTRPKRREPDPEPDDAYERAAARARSNDFEDTHGKDWT